MPKNPTYKKEQRKVFYLSSKYSRLLDAYAFHVFGDAKHKISQCGGIIVRAFFDKMPEHERVGLLAKYDKLTARNLEDGD